MGWSRKDLVSMRELDAAEILMLVDTAASLQEIAGRDGMTLAQLIEKLYDELVADRGAVGNFSSFLRVCALRYENLVAQGLIPRDASIPIRSLDADRVLAGLPRTPRGGSAPAGAHPPGRALN